MNIYTKAVQGISVTTENLPQLQQLPRLQVRSYDSGNTEWLFRCHSKPGDVLVMLTTSGKVLNFLVNQQDTISEGYPDDVLAIGPTGDYSIITAADITAHWQLAEIVNAGTI